MISAMISIVDGRICLSKLVGIGLSSQLLLGVNRIILSSLERVIGWNSLNCCISGGELVSPYMVEGADIFQWNWCISWQSCWWKRCWICQLGLGCYSQEAVVIHWFFPKGNCIHHRFACRWVSVMDVKKNSHSALSRRLDTGWHWQWNAVKASMFDLFLYQFFSRCLLCLMASVMSLLNQGTLAWLEHFWLLRGAWLSCIA